MSLLDVIELAASMSGELTDDGERTFGRGFLVRFDAKSDGPSRAIFASGIPRLGDSYQFGTESDTGAFVSGLSARVADGAAGKVFRVDVTYKTRTTDPSQQPSDPENPQDQDPLELPAKIATDFLARQIPIEKDLDGKLCATSAGQVFDDPPVMRDVFDGVVRIQKNRPYGAVTFDYVLSTMGNVNEKPFLGRAVDTVRMTAARIGIAFANGLTYLETEWEFTVRPEGWQEEKLDYGSVYLDSNGDKQVNVDAEGNVVKILLDGTGHIPTNENPEPVYISFRVHDRSDFTALGLGV